MKENDIARKCVAALLGVAGVVSISVVASHVVSFSGTEERARTTPTATRSSVESKLNPVSASTATTRPGPFLVPETPAVSTASSGDSFERKAFQLELENARLRGRLDDMLNWILENVRGTFPLPEEQMANLRVVPVDTNMAVSDDLAQVLRLNDEEIERLDVAFSGSKALLQDLEAENISVEIPSESQVVLSIPPFAEDGELVREELYDALKETLGAARFDRFLQVAETGLEEKFEYFGESDRTLQFEEVLDAATGGSQLFVRDERVVPNRDDPMRQDILASERLVTELPQEYYAYWNWLPEIVTRFGKSN